MKLLTTLQFLPFEWVVNFQSICILYKKKNSQRKRETHTKYKKKKTCSRRPTKTNNLFSSITNRNCNAQTIRWNENKYICKLILKQCYSYVGTE